MIDTNAFKNRILSLAYQGRLTNAVGNDAVNKNLELIHRQIKGYIPVNENEYLIKVPNNWNWTRLGYVTENHGKVTPNSIFSYIDVGTLDNVNHQLSSTENIVEAKDAPSRARKVVKKGDVIYSTVRPYLHNICIIDKEFTHMPIASTAFCVMHANETVLDNKYLFYWLLTTEFDKYSNGDSSKGALYPAIAEKNLLKGVIPLPSVSEQKKIVNRIEKAFSLLDKIKELQNQHILNRETLKIKLVSAALQGMLTKQLTEDGDVELFYKLIKEKKERLIKEKEIKSEKPLPAISEEGIPFETPKNWKWVYIGDIFQHNTGKALNASDTEGTLLEYITTSNLYWDKFELSCIKKMYFSEDEIDKCTITKGDLLVCEGGDIGRSAIWPYDYDMRIQNHIHRLRGFLPEICARYYYYILWLYKRNGMIDGRGIGLQGFSSKRLHALIVPLPPASEQKRIADTIDELLAILPH